MNCRCWYLLESTHLWDEHELGLDVSTGPAGTADRVDLTELGERCIPIHEISFAA